MICAVGDAYVFKKTYAINQPTISTGKAAPKARTKVGRHGKRLPVNGGYKRNEDVTQTVLMIPKAPEAQ